MLNVLVSKCDKTYLVLKQRRHGEMGKTVEVKLNTIDKVRNFVSFMSLQEGDFMLSEDGVLVNAKSIMGIFAMNLTKNLKLEIASSKRPVEELVRDLKPFLAY